MFYLLGIFVAGLASLITACSAEKPMDDKPVITLSGGIISPATQQEKIRMDLMQVNIRMQNGSYVLDAVFHLFNTGETTTEWVGFPKHGWGNFSLSQDDPLIRDFIRFECWVNDLTEVFVENLSFMHDSSHLFQEPPDITATKWMAKKITFPENTVTTIRISFEAPYNDAKASIPQNIGHFFLGPGQYWKGKIDRAEIVLEKNPDTDNKNSWIVFDHIGTTVKRIVTKTEIRSELRELEANSNGRLEFGHYVYPIREK
jgi:hypothetical protein